MLIPTDRATWLIHSVGSASMNMFSRSRSSPGGMPKSGIMTPRDRARVIYLSQTSVLAGLPLAFQEPASKGEKALFVANLPACQLQVTLQSLITSSTKLPLHITPSNPNI